MNLSNKVNSQHHSVKSLVPLSSLRSTYNESNTNMDVLILHRNESRLVIIFSLIVIFVAVVIAGLVVLLIISLEKISKNGRKLIRWFYYILDVFDL